MKIGDFFPITGVRIRGSSLSGSPDQEQHTFGDLGGAAAQELLKQLLADPRTLAAAFQGVSLLTTKKIQGLAGSDLVAAEYFFKLFAQNALSETVSPEKLVRAMLLYKGDYRAAQPESLSSSLVADLKTLAAEVVLQGDEEAESTSKGFDHLVRLVEAVKAFNALPVQGGKAFASIFPCFFMQGAGWGEWLISVDEEGGALQRKQARRVRLDFFLHMSRLGDVLVRAALTGATLSLEFLLADEDVRGHIAAMLPELTKCLADTGVAATLSCSILSSNLQHEMRNTLQERLGLKTSYSIINITA